MARAFRRGEQRGVTKRAAVEAITSSGGGEGIAAEIASGAADLVADTEDGGDVMAGAGYRVHASESELSSSSAAGGGGKKGAGKKRKLGELTASPSSSLAAASAAGDVSPSASAGGSGPALRLARDPAVASHFAQNHSLEWEFAVEWRKLQNSEDAEVARLAALQAARRGRLLLTQRARFERVERGMLDRLLDLRSMVVALGEPAYEAHARESLRRVSVCVCVCGRLRAACPRGTAKLH